MARGKIEFDREAAIKELKSAENEKKRALNNWHSLLKKYAPEFCPYKVGDVLINTRRNHLSGRFSVIMVGWDKLWDGDYSKCWRLVVAKFKKDGTIGKQTHKVERWNADGFELEK